MLVLVLVLVLVLEEQLLPVSLLGQEYVAAKSPSRGGEVDIWRIQAAEDGVVVSTAPPQKDVDGKTVVNIALAKGAFVQIEAKDSFAVSASKAVQVMQYLIGQTGTPDYTGDPALIGHVPTARFRSDYIIFGRPLVSTLGSGGPGIQHVVVVRTGNAVIMVDGEAIPESSYASVSGPWSRASVEVSAGTHRVTGSQPFGLLQYGYGPANAEGAPAGIGSGPLP